MKPIDHHVALAGFAVGVSANAIMEKIPVSSMDYAVGYGRYPLASNITNFTLNQLCREVGCSP
jgi:hypothetical protein